MGGHGGTSEAKERRVRFMQKQDKSCVSILRQIRDNGGKEQQGVRGFLDENWLLYQREANRKDGSTTVLLVVPEKLIPDMFFLNPTML